MQIGRVAALAIALAMAAGCDRSRIVRQYEYSEDMYLSLDGRATVYVNSSVAALDALRNQALDARPTGTVDRDRIRQLYETPVSHVVRSVTMSRRSNRRFVHVRVDVADIRRLSEARPFAWSKYELWREGEVYRYRQTIGPASGHQPPTAGWTGRELVAYRLHLPSKIVDHDNHAVFERGNILVWQQPLVDRLRGQPLVLEARMQTQSILYRTVSLFAATIVAVALTFGVVIVWMRSGASVVERQNPLR